MKALAMLAIATISLATPALACLPAPPEQLTPEWRRADQGRQWEAAGQVYEVEIIEARSIRWGEAVWDYGSEVVVRPVRALKGDLPSGEMVLRHLGGGMCGPWPAWDVLVGQPGETYILFSFSTPAPTQDSIRASLSPSRILEPGLAAALAR
ncbi:MAG: hypothetical protein EON85_02360 [Brevundimonas sp.]|nr:MAG: hypothetical protein EON85_02360 [Brevundimonas sp.]